MREEETEVSRVWVVYCKTKKMTLVCETWVRSLGWEDPLEEGMATHIVCVVGLYSRSDQSNSINKGIET